MKRPPPHRSFVRPVHGPLAEVALRRLRPAHAKLDEFGASPSAGRRSARAAITVAAFALSGCAVGNPPELVDWYADCDADGVFAPAETRTEDRPAGDAALVCAGGRAPAGGWSTVAGTDCDDSDPTTTAVRDWFPDCDGDGVAADAATNACGIAGADAVFACAGGNPPMDWFASAGTDCNDEDASGSALVAWYPDCDGDGSSRAVEVIACGTTGANAAYDCEGGGDPAGWRPDVGDDCDDDNALNPCACGQQDNDGDGACQPVSSLATALGASTGVVDLQLATGTLPVFVDGDFEGGGWVLVGRGREDWAFTDDGVGEPAELIAGLGTPDAFAPRYLSAADIQPLLDNARVDMTGVQMRVRRAASADGSAYQDSLWHSLAQSTWTWLFEASSYGIEYTVLDSVLGAGRAYASGNTRDVGNNDHRRTFTWTWSRHGAKTGFSYGASIRVGTNAAESFLWEFADEDHALPYAEVYVRLRPPESCLEILTRNPEAVDGLYDIDPDGFGGAEAFEVACDMSDGGYTVIYAEDFAAGESAGWQDAAGVATPVDTVSSCVEDFGPMLGGYGLLGRGVSTQQIFDLLGVPHSELSVSLDYVVLDSWDAEDAVVVVNGVESFRRSFQAGAAAEDLCGGASKDHGAQRVVVEQTHGGNAATVEVTSTLNSRPTDESFGVDNVVIRVR